MKLSFHSLFRFLAIPENDTGSRRRTVNFVPLTGTVFCLSAVFCASVCALQALYSLSLSFACIDLGVKLRISAPLAP